MLGGEMHKSQEVCTRVRQNAQVPGGGGGGCRSTGWGAAHLLGGMHECLAGDAGVLGGGCTTAQWGCTSAQGGMLDFQGGYRSVREGCTCTRVDA